MITLNLTQEQADTLRIVLLLASSQTLREAIAADSDHGRAHAEQLDSLYQLVRTASARIISPAAQREADKLAEFDKAWAATQAGREAIAAQAAGRPVVDLWEVSDDEQQAADEARNAWRCL